MLQASFGREETREYFLETVAWLAYFFENYVRGGEQAIENAEATS